MRRKIEKAIRESFDFPKPQHMDEFLSRAEVISAEEKKRNRGTPLKFRVSAAAMACLVAVGLWADLRNRSALSDMDLHGNENIIAESTGSSSDQPVTACGDSDTITTTTAVQQSAACTTTTSLQVRGTGSYAVTSSTAFTALGAAGVNGVTVSVPSRTNRKETTTTSTISRNDTATTTTRAKTNERIFNVKKLGAFATAVLASSPDVSIPDNADYTLPYTRLHKGEADIFEEFKAHSRDLDLNKDGVFDLKDCYELFLYSNGYDLSAAAAGKCSSLGVGSVTEAGDNEWLTPKNAVRYCIVTKGLRITDLDASAYPDSAYTEAVPLENRQSHRSSELFISEVYSESRALMAGYPLLSEAISAGRLDPDFDSSGTFDITDYVYYSIWSANLWRAGTENESKVWELPENISGSCAEFCQTADELTHDSWSSAYLVWCLMEKEPFRSGYDEAQFYDSFIPVEYRPYYSPDINFRTYCEATGMKEYLLTFHADKFNRYFDTFCSDVEAGARPAPDVNMDGAVDKQDYYASDIYLGDILCGRTAQESELPEDVFNNIAANCDYNGNGISGDIYDILITEMYVISLDNDVCESSGETAEVLSRNDVIPDINALDKERSGDANCDGTVDMADVLLIIQSCCNPDKYQLTESGRYNADVSDTGNGITPADAQALQLKLLNS
ncbi:MAG: hypothetical protein IKH78_06450 [Ruminococcus sp.]|nr:hypothetical protein [Ruminococcus sp.]